MSADLIRWTGGPGAEKPINSWRWYGRGGGRPDLDDMILMTFSRSQAADLADRLARSVFPARTGKTSSGGARRWTG